MAACGDARYQPSALLDRHWSNIIKLLIWTRGDMFLNVAWMRMQKHSKTSACSGCFKKRRKQSHRQESTTDNADMARAQCRHRVFVWVCVCSAPSFCVFVCSVRSPRSCVSYIMYRNSYSYIIARTTLLILLAAASPSSRPIAKPA